MPLDRKFPPALLTLSLGLAACQSLAPMPADPRVTELARSVEERAATFYAALAAAPAPDCAFEANAPAYAELAGLAGQLQDRLANGGPGQPLRLAADALARTVADARLSHEKASEVVTDPSGPCMAPGAIALNAGAIARASQAIAATAGEER